MCDCQSTSANITYQPVSCRDITVDTLSLYESLVQGLIISGDYNKAETNSLECSNAVEILQLWKKAKSDEPDSCKYHEYMPVMQELVKRIILNQ